MSLRSLVFVAILACASVSLADRPHVYLLSGQSNMQGSGRVADIPESVPREIPNAYLWNGKTFEPMVLGQTKLGANPNTFGPEVGFALKGATAEHPVYLIKYFASGMPLYHGWNGGKWEGTEPGPKRRNFYPGLTPDDPNVGALYQQMLSMYKKGLAELAAQGEEPQVEGFLWMQGEMDAKGEESAISYAANLKRLRDRLAADLKLDAELPMVYGQVLPHEPAAPRFTHRTETRQQMADADADSGKPEAIPNAKMVSTDGFEVLADTVHYSAKGQLQLGEAMAAAMQKLTQKGR
ncbi:sialate O-acetylesterase [Blastopirellula sp. JC732]|uniref:Sialate O-acetylesterase n=1 Tax=Blastopirellula sediminis TaxID=2894196 RepID=A0A9X1MPS6_9BACT|nr:sialate O-acetylesterase [Blastopirellula sediminis]MCC9606567.1 sialate O-acetylesterase [Blastopirellula sediminis]MCC9630135.1 sialate O-acetylesterase [Blastopirellula sediminis]